MFFVALVALDFTALRAVLDHDAAEINLLGIGALPMANVLAVGLLVGYRSRDSRGFLLGFELVGAVALAAYIAGATMLARVLIFRYLHLATDPYIRTFVSQLPATTFHNVILCSIGVVMFGLPQLAFALIGGLLSRNYRAAEWPDRT
jgi:hypothetical protein